MNQNQPQTNSWGKIIWTERKWIWLLEELSSQVEVKSVRIEDGCFETCLDNSAKIRFRDIQLEQLEVCKVKRFAERHFYNNFLLDLSSAKLFAAKWLKTDAKWLWISQMSEKQSKDFFHRVFMYVAYSFGRPYVSINYTVCQSFQISLCTLKNHKEAKILFKFFYWYFFRVMLNILRKKQIGICHVIKNLGFELSKVLGSHKICRKKCQQK